MAPGGGLLPGAEERRRSEAGLVARYLDRLGAAGVEVAPDAFARSFDENLLWWLGQYANNLAHLEPGNRAQRRGLELLVARICAAAEDHRVGRLLV